MSEEHGTDTQENNLTDIQRNLRQDTKISEDMQLSKKKIFGEALHHSYPWEKSSMNKNVLWMHK